MLVIWQVTTMPNNKLLLAMGLPPKSILDYLKKMSNNKIPTEKWNDIDKNSRKNAFTVAGVMKLDILDIFLNEIIETRKNGGTVKDFKINVEKKLESVGWTKTNPSRFKLIYETNVNTSYAKGKFDKQTALKEEFPYVQYKQIQRKGKRKEHSKLDGKVFRIDDPNLRSIYPPSEFGCKCRLVQLSAKEVKELNLEPITLNPNNFKEGTISPLDDFIPDISKYTNKSKIIAARLIRGSKNG